MKNSVTENIFEVEKVRVFLEGDIYEIYDMQGVWLDGNILNADELFEYLKRNKYEAVNLNELLQD